MKTRIAPTGAAIRMIQQPASKSKSIGDSQKATDNSISKNKPIHLNERRVFRLTCGSRPHPLHRQCFQKPTGKIGIPKMCPTSKVRIATDWHGAWQERQ
ncbi:MAG TPA: hypothetical protein VGM18_17230 [Candidatus Sulfotelmatobacter sp.]|jgi:hypothetical protein